MVAVLWSLGCSLDSKDLLVRRCKLMTRCMTEINSLCPFRALRKHLRFKRTETIWIVLGYGKHLSWKFGGRFLVKHLSAGRDIQM